MKKQPHPSQRLQEKRKSDDRRKSTRYAAVIPIHIRLAPDGTPINGSAIELGPNGMRISTNIPLVESGYVHISFQEASNNTHCEGRVVWTEHQEDALEYESGIDIQRWGGSIPDPQAMPNTTPKKDRRK